MPLQVHFRQLQPVYLGPTWMSREEFESIPPEGRVEALIEGDALQLAGELSDDPEGNLCNLLAKLIERVEWVAK